MYNLKTILLLLLLHSSYAMSNSNGFDKLAFDSDKKRINRMFNKIDNGVKRNIYDILDSVNSSKAKLLKKWFRVASQVTYNEKLAFFIKNTNYKVSAITEQLFLENNSITQKKQKLFHEKFRFLFGFAKKKFEPLNQNIYATVDINLRTMPIVSKLTKKRYITRKYIIIRKKTILNLLYKIDYTIEGKDVSWGYIESKIDDRVGWINLKYTKKSRR